VLIVPYAGRFETIGREVLIAWSPRHEAARAMRDALPLLQHAEKVRLVAVASSDDEARQWQRDFADAVEWLGRHGVKTTASLTVSEVDVGNELLSLAADPGVDLIVMGGYGHTRLREFVLGGATRTLLQSMTVPVLMSH
jgi:nucleotide-binding universal stress UspA family protein